MVCIYFGASTWCEVGGYIVLLKYVLFSFLLEFPTKGMMWWNMYVSKCFSLTLHVLELPVRSPNKGAGLR